MIDHSTCAEERRQRKGKEKEKCKTSRNEQHSQLLKSGGLVANVLSLLTEERVDKGVDRR